MSNQRQGRWVATKRLSAAEKAEITAACDQFIADKLRPRFLPEIRETKFNYAVDLFGKWRGSRYSFITRYRSGFPEKAGEEFDAACTRLDHIEECLDGLKFDVMWHRHTGQWWRLHSSVTLDATLRLIETEGLLQPHL
jgi:hypothetical protein